MLINLEKLSDPEEVREYVLLAFREKCLKCRKPTRVVHEIEYRSRRPKTWWWFENRVPLCHECHRWAHDNPSISGKILEELRTRRLEEYDIETIGSSRNIKPSRSRR
jgi:5-methylcytosine-specific restriction endonuclease McrA